MKDWVDAAIRKDVIAAQELLHKYCAYRDSKCHREDMDDCPFYGTAPGKYAYHYCLADGCPANWVLAK